MEPLLPARPSSSPHAHHTRSPGPQGNVSFVTVWERKPRGPGASLIFLALVLLYLAAVFSIVVFDPDEAEQQQQRQQQQPQPQRRPGDELEAQVPPRHRPRPRPALLP